MNGLGLNILLKLMDENARMSGGVGPDYDYSKAGMPDSRGHTNDAGKLKNHITFSNESQQANSQYPGGVWRNDFQGASFQPTQRMINEHGADRYREYFKQHEPDVRLILGENK